jgi:hypothetical protein
VHFAYQFDHWTIISPISKCTICSSEHHFTIFSFGLLRKILVQNHKFLHSSKVKKVITIKINTDQNHLPTTNPHLYSSASFIFGFSQSVWTYTTHVEVFGLNHLLIAILLNLLVRVWDLSQTQNFKQLKRTLYLGAFISGLALTNQQ